ncbi:hypothetical protein [Mucilaginibacter sp.]|uniref:hypothetical protein n=1 Tax=Mucilaginibacter sp. TaxID=1882438 RepID=UPI0025F71845|nr:hypothetical protein [Mucilaginibacter sp.]
MDTQQPDKCKNCGAALQPSTAATLKCNYCGSIFEKTATAVSPQAQPNGNNNPSQQVKNYPVDPSAKQVNSGCGLAVLIFIILAAVLALLIKYTGQGSSYNLSDSTAVDSSLLHNTIKPARDASAAAIAKAEKDSTLKSKLKELSLIEVDAATFKKLYRNTRRRYDQFSRSTFIYDQTSPRYINVKGIFVYLSQDTTGNELRLTTQYTADNWLFINSMSFNADGENFNDFSPKFKRDNGQGMIWEWSDEPVPDLNLSMLAKIATAKRAKIRYDGEQYYNELTITAAQKAAIKRQLQVYKGLLLGYDKTR